MLGLSRPGDESPLAKFSTERFGGLTHIREQQVTVGTAGDEILANNPARVFSMVINESNTEINVSFVRDGVTGGLPLPPNGGAISLSVEEDGEAVGWQLFGRATVAGEVVRTVEVLRL